METTSQPVNRIVRMALQPDSVGKFLTLFEQYKTVIRAQPGCLHLELWQDLHAPHFCTTYSIWQAEADLNAYRKSALFGIVWPETKKLLAQPAIAFSTTCIARP